MTSILDKTGIYVSEKVRLYNQALLRYNDLAEMSATKPTPAATHTATETETDADTETKEISTGTTFRRLGVLLKTGSLSRDRHTMTQPCTGVVITGVFAVIIVCLAILLTTSPQSYHWCPGGAVPWDARNYSNLTTILNVSEVIAVLLLCEEYSPNKT